MPATSSDNQSTFDAIGNLISLLVGGISGGAVAAFLFKALLVPALAAAIGAFVGFHVNRWLKKRYDKKQKQDELKRTSEESVK